MTRIVEMERQNAERRIERLIYRFAALNDQAQAGALAKLFTQDGVFSRPSDPANPVRGRAAIEAHFKERPPRTTRHIISNVEVDLVDSTRATAHSYVTLFSGPSGDATVTLTSILIGDFDDELVKESGRWLFQKRSGSLRLRGKIEG